MPEVCPAPKGRFDLELAKVLLDVAVLPMMATPIVDPVVDSMVSPAVYPEPPLPVVLEAEPVPVLESSPFREVAGNPVQECSQSFQASPVGSGYGPIPLPDIGRRYGSQMFLGHRPVWPRWTSTCHGLVPHLGRGESSDSPLLPRPLTPR